MTWKPLISAAATTSAMTMLAMAGATTTQHSNQIPYQSRLRHQDSQIGPRRIPFALRQVRSSAHGPRHSGSWLRIDAKHPPWVPPYHRIFRCADSDTFTMDR